MADLTGQQFGGFVVTKRAAARDRVRYWELGCKGCGLIKEEMQVTLKAGYVPDCGGCGDPDPFAYGPDDEECVAAADAAPKDDAWIWPWSKPELDAPPAPKLLTPDEAAADLYERIDARIEAERIEREVVVEVAADMNGDTAEIVADVALVTEDSDPFAEFGEEDDGLRPEVTFVDIPASYFAPTAPDPDELHALMVELSDRLKSPLAKEPNPIADAVDSIAAALTQLAKALRG